MQPDVCKFGCGGKEQYQFPFLQAGLRSVLTKAAFYSSCVGVGHLHKCKLGAAAPKKDKPRPLQMSILTVNHSGSDQLVSVIPGSKLSGGDAPLRLVEDNVPTLFGHVQYTSLQGLAVADPHREAGMFAGC